MCPLEAPRAAGTGSVGSAVIIGMNFFPSKQLCASVDVCCFAHFRFVLLFVLTTTVNWGTEDLHLNVRAHRDSILSCWHCCKVVSSHVAASGVQNKPASMLKKKRLWYLEGGGEQAFNKEHKYEMIGRIFSTKCQAALIRRVFNPPARRCVCVNVQRRGGVYLTERRLSKQAERAAMEIMNKQQLSRLRFNLLFISVQAPVVFIFLF